MGLIATQVHIPNGVYCVFVWRGDSFEFIEGWLRATQRTSPLIDGSPQIYFDVNVWAIGINPTAVPGHGKGLRLLQTHSSRTTLFPCWCSVGNVGMSLEVPLKETTSSMVYQCHSIAHSLRTSKFPVHFDLDELVDEITGLDGCVSSAGHVILPTGNS